MEEQNPNTDQLNDQGPDTATAGAAVNNEQSQPTEDSTQASAAAAGAGEKTASKRTATKGTKKKAASKASKKPAANGGRHLVTATLPKRLVRVRFVQGGKVVAQSTEYNSGNTIDKIVAFARRQIGAAKIGEAKPKPQESTDGGKHWSNVEMPSAPAQA